MPAKPPRTLAQMRAEALAKEGKDPWACPRCGCHDWRVANSYMVAGRRQRRRICRHCGQGLIHTSEVPVPDGHTVVVVEGDDNADAA